MISHRFHIRRKDRKISLGTKWETVMMASFQLDAYRRGYCFSPPHNGFKRYPNWAEFAEVQGYLCLLHPPSRLSTIRCQCFMFSESFTLREFVHALFQNSKTLGSRLNFTPSPPRDVEAETRGWFTDGLAGTKLSVRIHICTTKNL
jgi:hypothetical protein